MRTLEFYLQILICILESIKVISCVYDSDVYNELSVFPGRMSEFQVDPVRLREEKGVF